MGSIYVSITSSAQAIFTRQSPVQTPKHNLYKIRWIVSEKKYVNIKICTHSPFLLVLYSLVKSIHILIKIALALEILVISLYDMWR